VDSEGISLDMCGGTFDESLPLYDAAIHHILWPVMCCQMLTVF